MSDEDSQRSEHSRLEPWMDGVVKTFGPIGRCIYCGAKDLALQREHIIPYGLSGDMILLNASCANCARITGAVERDCLQKIFKDARIHLGLKSRGHRRNKKPRPPLQIVGDNQIPSAVSIDRHPLAFGAPLYPPPGVLVNRDPREHLLIDCKVIMSDEFNARFKLLPPKTWIQFSFAGNLVARMLAKIAHSYAVASYGIDSFNHLLPQTILGRQSVPLHYVGCAISYSSDPAASLHEITISKAPPWILVHVRLFAQMKNTPTYLIVTGRLA